MARWRGPLTKLLAVIASVAAGLAAHERSEPSGALARERIARAYLALPLAFERNEGQAPDRIAFLARGIGHALALEPGEAVLSLARRGTASWHAMHLSFVGANPDPEIRGSEELPGRSHYLLGADRADWHTDVSRYARVTYRDLYPGIDLVFRGSGQQLEYDFVVAPNASPQTIRLRIDGAESLAVDAAGDLHLQSGALDLIQHAPRTHQDVAGGRVEVASRFVLHEGREIGFEVAAYDRARPLVIDPVLSYATYLGGSGEDGVSGSILGEHLGIAVDASGSAIVTGETQSSDFPVAGAVQEEAGGGLDVFVSKFMPNGQGLVYSTYLGGSDDDSGNAIAIDAVGNAIVTGTTRSGNFPVLAASQPAIAGASDAFVAKLSPLGDLLFSTFLGGGDDDSAAAVAIDGPGNIHLAGATRSTNFPVQSALQPTSHGGEDAFVARLTATGARSYATYLGGAGDDAALALALGPAGIVVAGRTSSADFPTVTPLQAALHGESDAFVARLSASGASLLASTFVGGGGTETASGVVVLASGVAVVVGETTSQDFPTAQPMQAQSGGGDDAFLLALAPNGAGLVFATYLGGSEDDAGVSIVGSGGALFAAGTTESTDFPTAAPMQPGNAGEHDAWLARLGPNGTTLAVSTYLGGESDDDVFALAADTAGRLFIAGYTNSRLFPTFQALKTDLGVGSDAFVTAIEPGLGSFAYSTYLGGSSEESSALVGQAIAVDGDGDAYVTGPTLSTGLATSGALQTLPRGASDALIAKLDAGGAALEWATYLGGRGDDAGLGIAVDATGHAVVTGRTNSVDFPVAGALQPSKAGGFDAFVTKLTPGGNGLVYSTFLGGGGSDLARAVALDATGAPVVAGTTRSTDFPVRNALQPALAGGSDAFLAKLSASGAALDWSTYLGGSRDENPTNTTWGVALDPTGNVLVSGTTESDDFPTVLPVQPVRGIGRDAYVAKIGASGGPLLFSTFLGGEGGDTARDIASDAYGRIYVVGATRSGDFPIVNAFQPVHDDPLWYDAFVARIGPSPSGPVLDFSTFLGGSGLDGALAVDVDPAGNIHVAGQTTSPDFPLAGGGGSLAGAADDVFVTVLPSAGDRIAYSTRFGGDGSEIALGIVTDRGGSAHLTGITTSPDFPTVAALQPAPGGGADAFVAKLALAPGAFACEIATDQSSYAVGQVVRIARLRFANAGALPLPARLRIDLVVPAVGTIDLLRSYRILPANLDADLGPFPLFAVDGTRPHGTWTVGCALDDPASGAPIARQTAAFSIP